MLVTLAVGFGVLFGVAPAFGVTTVEDCQICHDLAVAHPGHISAVTDGFVKVFTGPHQNAGPNLGVTTNCDRCHDVENISAVHGGDCSLCHPGPRASFTTWNKTCQQGDCHPTVHAGAEAAHQTIVAKGIDHDGCPCHDPGPTFQVDINRCAQCHIINDNKAPVTTCDLCTCYYTDAMVTLCSVDYPNPGASGVTRTYWQLDGGAMSEGTTLSVPLPATGSATHTLTHWSVDAKGNVEARRTCTFTSIRDTTPPSTRSDAATQYVGTASITLFATDNSDRPITTCYKLDSGPQKTGRSVSVPAYGAHTLEFWSVDSMGNEELPHKTARFTVIEPDTTAPRTASNAKTSYFWAASISLTASDNVGGTGLKATYYRVNGGTPTTGTAVSVIGCGTYTLEFWSVDNAGNVESPHKSATFTIVPQPTGTIKYTWFAPYGAWVEYFAYDSAGNLAVHGNGLGGVISVTVPVSPDPYRLEAYWYDPEADETGWSYGSALIDTPGKVVTWYY